VRLGDFMTKTRVVALPGRSTGIEYTVRHFALAIHIGRI
jgi:hypothetical protein